VRVKRWPRVADGPAALRAVLLDVDFTVLRPGASFSVEGYCATAARFGLRLDPDRWREAERRAAAAVAARRGERGDRHDDGVHLTIAEAIVTTMGERDGEPPARQRVDLCAAAIVAAWGRPENFALYDDVRPCLARLRANGLAVGLISNTTRDLDELITAFALGDLVDGAVTSAQVGVFKPAPAIFAAALERIDAAAGEAVMVGDSRRDDVEGALAAGLAGAVLLDRDGRSSRRDGRAAVIGSLDELPAVLGLV
jgi:putative hydrolase of the HAD superfamily